MIDPKNITNFTRTERELQLFWIFCIIVAGRNADMAARKVGQLFGTVLKEGETPFQYLQQNRHAIHNMLVAHKVGQYYRIERAIDESLALDLSTCTLQDLTSIYGVGPKTARFFLLHTRRDCEHVVMDVHILRYLRQEYMMDVPQQTPSPEKYDAIEKVASKLLRLEFAGMSMADIDLLLWCRMSGRLDNQPETV